VIRDAEAVDQRQPQRRREAKGMENGRTPIMTSTSVSLNTCITLSMFDRMLRWVSMTPFGMPVLPLEKMIVARSSGSESAA